MTGATPLFLGETSTSSKAQFAAALCRRTPSLFETGAGAVAVLRADLPVIRADFGHGAVAPAMADVAEFFARGLEYLVRLRRDIHFFRPKIFAEIWVHNHAVS
jgi:hypothetical protein